MPHEPKKRHSRARQGKRRASIKLTPTATVICKNCASRHLPHNVCANCGYYKGRLIKTPKTQKTKSAVA